MLPQAAPLTERSEMRKHACLSASNQFVCAGELQLICLALPNVLRGQTNVLQLR